MAELTLIIAFIAGIVSFLSPCVLPLLPAFLGYLAGTNPKQAKTKTLVWHSILFVIGFSTVFAILGVLLNGLLSSVAYWMQDWLNRISGTIIIFFGFYLLGLVKPQVLMKPHKLKIKKFASKEITSVTLGAAFAVGWTPCVGAILGSVFALAVSMPANAFWLLMSYSLGLGVPFILMAFFAKHFLKVIEKRRRFLKYFNIAVGVLIVLLGVLVFTGKLALIASSATFLVVAVL